VIDVKTKRLLLCGVRGNLETEGADGTAGSDLRADGRGRSAVAKLRACCELQMGGTETTSIQVGSKTRRTEFPMGDPGLPM